MLHLPSMCLKYLPILGMICASIAQYIVETPLATFLVGVQVISEMYTLNASPYRCISASSLPMVMDARLDADRVLHDILTEWLHSSRVRTRQLQLELLTVCYGF